MALLWVYEQLDEEAKGSSEQKDSHASSTGHCLNAQHLHYEVQTKPDDLNDAHQEHLDVAHSCEERCNCD